MSKIALLIVMVALIVGFTSAAGDLAIPGLDGVRVELDEYGIAQVYAETPRELFAAQGYLHARDRWWQMEMTRRQAAGRLSELLGADFVEQDRLVRAMGVPQNAAASLPLLSPDARALLEAYADGANRWLAGKTPGEIALEYTFLDVDAVEAWRIEDTLLLQAVQSFGSEQLNLTSELLKTAIAQTSGGLVAELILPPYPAVHPTTLHPGATLDAPAAALHDTDIELAFAPFDLPTFGGYGSNGWVVSGARTTSGLPLLANDSHWVIEMPSIWYEIGLHCTEQTDACPYNVFGLGFAGAPGVIVGHNDALGWGLTNAFTDGIDVYLLTLNPDDPTQYLLDGEYVDLDVRTETIQVAGGDSVTFEARTSAFGGVFDTLSGVDLGQPFAVRWNAQDGNRSLDAVLLMNRALNWDEFQTAVGYFDAPGLHVLYGDTAGNIGYINSGRIPRRAHGGDLARVVESRADDWAGYVDPADNPRLFNPDAGYIVSANNAALPPGEYPYTLASVQDFGWRAARIEQLLSETPLHSSQSFARMQQDNHNPAAALLLPVLTAIAFDDPELSDAAVWLAAWDRQDDADSPHAALFNAFYARFLRLALDELPIYEGSHSLYLLSTMLNVPHPLWANAERGYTLFSRDQILADALREALTLINDRLGTDRAAWQWGDLHIARFGTHLPAAFGATDTFERVVSLNGGWATVNTAEWALGSDNFEVTKIASMRMIADFSDLGASWFVNSTGQSGDPRSPHYNDLMALWMRGAYQGQD
ncbi:MAG: penicillin acylase family protein [Chloroflexota bacterium]|nr:penicillin acylase family protein [Chloroflexota bacterium]